MGLPGDGEPILPSVDPGAHVAADAPPSADRFGQTVEAFMGSLALPPDLKTAGEVRGVLRCRHGKPGGGASELAVLTEEGDVVELNGWKTSYTRGDDDVRLMCKKCPIDSCVWTVDKGSLMRRVGAQGHRVENIFIEEVATSHPL